MARCKKCNREIVWVRTVPKDPSDPDDNGSPMPADPTKRTVLVPEMVGSELRFRVNAKTLAPHWATCPNADEFRKKKPSPKQTELFDGDERADRGREEDV